MKYVVQIWDLWDGESSIEDVYETDDYAKACIYALDLKHQYDSCGLSYVAVVAEKFMLGYEEDIFMLEDEEDL